MLSGVKIGLKNTIMFKLDIKQLPFLLKTKSLILHSLFKEKKKKTLSYIIKVLN